MLRVKQADTDSFQKLQQEVAFRPKPAHVFALLARPPFRLVPPDLSAPKDIRSLGIP